MRASVNASERLITLPQNECESRTMRALDTCVWANESHFISIKLQAIKSSKHHSVKES